MRGTTEEEGDMGKSNECPELSMAEKIAVAFRKEVAWRARF